MKKWMLLFCSIGMLQLRTKAQDQETAVKEVIHRFFAAMKAADTLALKNCLAPNAQLQTIMTNQAGKSTVMQEPMKNFIQQIGRLPKDFADEQISFGAIHIDEALANVWTPYHLYVNRQFSHCGINNFVLVQLADGWKIQYIIDTRRKSGCSPTAQ